MYYFAFHILVFQILHYFHFGFPLHCITVMLYVEFLLLFHDHDHDHDHVPCSMTMTMTMFQALLVDVYFVIFYLLSAGSRLFK